MTYSKYWKIKTLIQKYSNQQSFISFKYEKEIKTFPDKQKLRDSINTRLTLQEMLKGVLIPETKRQKYTKLWEIERQNQKISTLYQNSSLNTLL